MNIYHYTDSAGLIGVLEFKALWVNDVMFMNDSQEVFDAFNTLRDVAIRNNDQHLLLTLSGLDFIQNQQPSYMHTMLGGYFITSFCLEDDLLEMWRGYGSGGQKYSVEFDAEILLHDAEAALPEAQFSLEKCVYSKEEKELAIERFLEENPLDAQVLQAGIQGTIKFDAGWWLKFSRLAVTFKNSGFESEKEIRLIGKIDDQAKLTHRVNNFGITPYYKLNLTRPSIVSCRIGPSVNKALSAYSLASLFKKSDSFSPWIVKKSPDGSFLWRDSATSFRSS